MVCVRETHLNQALDDACTPFYDMCNARRGRGRCMLYWPVLHDKWHECYCSDLTLILPIVRSCNSDSRINSERCIVISFRKGTLRWSPKNSNKTCISVDNGWYCRNWAWFGCRDVNLHCFGNREVQLNGPCIDYQHPVMVSEIIGVYLYHRSSWKAPVQCNCKIFRQNHSTDFYKFWKTVFWNSRIISVK